MARKKTEEKSQTKQLEPGSYWEYRCTIEELKNAKLNQRRVNLENELRNKEIENQKLKLALFKETVRAAQTSTQKAEEELEKIKQRLEQELGMSLENCVIDPHTYEVKSLEEPKI